MKIEYAREEKHSTLSDLKGNYKIDLGERVVAFAVNTIRFLSTIQYKKD